MKPELPEILGSLTSTTVLSAVLGVALWIEGVGAFLSVAIALVVWWIIGLLYELRWK